MGTYSFLAAFSLSSATFARMDLGERIRLCRIEAGLTQARVARAAGGSRRHLSALEKGANISMLVFTRVCEVLAIRPSELFERSTKSYRSVFISYGGPDEGIARRIYDELT